MPTTTTAPAARAPAIPLPLPRSSRAARLPRDPGTPARSLTPEQLSTLPWKGFSHGSGGRTAWSARAAGPVETYPCAPDGCFCHDPHDHVLLPVSVQLPSQREASFDARLAGLPGIRAPRRVALTQSIACAPRAH